MRGNRTATAAPRPQTGFEDRPGHQALAFQTERVLPAEHVFSYLTGPPRAYEGQDQAAALLPGEGVPTPMTIHPLGHTDISITLKVYAHMPPDRVGTAALARNGLLEEATEPPEALKACLTN